MGSLHRTGAYAFNVGRTVASGSLDGNIVVLLEVYPSVASREELTENKGKERNAFLQTFRAMATQKQLKVGSSALLFQALVGGRALGPVFVSGVLPPAVAAAAAAATAEASALVSVRVQTSSLIRLRALMGKSLRGTSAVV